MKKIDEFVIVTRMAEALRGVDLNVRSARAAAYIAADIDPDHIARFDHRAASSERSRRRAFPAYAITPSIPSLEEI